MTIPVIRNPTPEETAANKQCSTCSYWLPNPHSYVLGVCILGGEQITPRWSKEGKMCDGFVAGA